MQLEQLRAAAGNAAFLLQGYAHVRRMQNRHRALALRQLADRARNILVQLISHRLALVLLVHHLSQNDKTMLHIVIGFQAQHNDRDIIRFQCMQIALVHALISNDQVRLQLHDFFYVNIKNKANLGSVLRKLRHLAQLRLGATNNLAVHSLHQLQKRRRQDNNSFGDFLQRDYTLIVIGDFCCSAHTSSIS